MGEALTSALADVSTIFTQATTMITGNEVAMIFIGMSVVGGGIGLFRKIARR